MMDTAYKVVAVNNGILTSATIVNRWKVQYELNVPVHPLFSQSKLFAFKDLEDALNWVDGLDQYSRLLAIYECQVKNPIPAKVCSFVLESYELLEFWNDIIAVTKTPVPTGTIWVDSVTLTRFIK